MFFNRQERPALVCTNDNPAGIPDGMPEHSDPPRTPMESSMPVLLKPCT